MVAGLGTPTSNLTVAVAQGQFLQSAGAVVGSRYYGGTLVQVKHLGAAVTTGYGVTCSTASGAQVAAFTCAVPAGTQQNDTVPCHVLPGTQTTPGAVTVTCLGPNPSVAYDSAGDAVSDTSTYTFTLTTSAGTASFDYVPALKATGSSAAGTSLAAATDLSLFGGDATLVPRFLSGAANSSTVLLTLRNKAAPGGTTGQVRREAAVALQTSVAVDAWYL